MNFRTWQVPTPDETTVSNPRATRMRASRPGAPMAAASLATVDSSGVGTCQVRKFMG